MTLFTADRLAALRARFGDPHLLFVGRLRHYKGLHHLLDAMPAVDARIFPRAQRSTRIAFRIPSEGQSGSPSMTTAR